MAIIWLLMDRLRISLFMILRARLLEFLKQMLIKFIFNRNFGKESRMEKLKILLCVALLLVWTIMMKYRNFKMSKDSHRDTLIPY